MNPPSRVTLADVARATGFSETTVSFALNGVIDRVSPDTRAKVERVAREMGYRPNWRARALASKRTELIAYASARPSPMASGLNEQINSGLCVALNSRGYYPLLVPLVGDPAKWDAVISPDRVDGWLLGYPLPPDPAHLFTRAGVPLVVVNAETDLPVPHVMPDDFAAGVDATRALLEHGHRRIGFLTHGPAERGHFSMALRRDGYRHAMSAAGLTPREVVVSKGDQHALRPLLTGDAPLTAVVVYDHWLALGLLDFARQISLKLPDQLSIITFNDDEFLSVTYVSLSTIDIPGQAIGKRAAELLVEAIDARVTARGDKQSTSRSSAQRRSILRIPGTVILRDSVRRL